MTILLGKKSLINGFFNIIILNMLGYFLLFLVIIGYFTLGYLRLL